MTTAVSAQESSKPVEFGAAMVSALVETPPDVMEAALEGDGLTTVLGMLISATETTSEGEADVEQFAGLLQTIISNVEPERVVTEVIGVVGAFMESQGELGPLEAVLTSVGITLTSMDGSSVAGQAVMIYLDTLVELTVDAMQPIIASEHKLV